jgi:Spy/CpxP family protein refolding chaperone
MFQRLKPLLVFLSLALNVSVFFVWFMCHHSQGAACPTTENSSYRLHKEIGVNDDQWRQIEPKMNDFRKGSQTLCHDVEQQRLQLIDLILASETNTAAIRAKQEEILTSQRKMQELVLSQLLFEKQVLTQEQQQKLFKMLKCKTGCPGHASESSTLCGQKGCIGESIQGR